MLDVESLEKVGLVMDLKELSKEGILKLAVHRRFINPVSEKDISTVNTLEVELSSLLSYYHQLGQIKLGSVPFFSIENKPTGNLSSVIPNRGFMSCEWPLVATGKPEVDIWGNMRVDNIYIDSGKNNIVLFENKVGSKFTSGGTQLERYVSYLKQTKIQNKYLLLISLKQLVDNKWYINEIQEWIKNKKPDLTGVSLGVIFWDDVINSFTSNTNDIT